MATTKAYRQRAGFTLIEVLASIVILLLIVLAMGRIFASVSKVYAETTKQAERDAASRAVMDLIAREISEAMFEKSWPNANSNALLSMRYAANTSKDNFGFESDELWLVSANNVMPHPSQGSFDDLRRARQALQVTYWVQNYVGVLGAPTNSQYRFALWRDFQYPNDGPQWNSYFGGTNGVNWAGTRSAVPSRGRNNAFVENVRAFEIFGYSDESGTRVINWDSRGSSAGEGDQPLFCMDLYLETMSEADAIRAAQLAASLGPQHARTIEFVESVVRRQYERIYFPNKFGYFDYSYP